MRKKIILITFCLILFLIFTALSYGEIDPKYKARGHPWQHMLSPRPDDNQNLDFLLIGINPNIYILLTIQFRVKAFSNSTEPATQKLDSFVNQHDSLTKNETNSEK